MMILTAAFNVGFLTFFSICTIARFHFFGKYLIKNVNHMQAESKSLYSLLSACLSRTFACGESINQYKILKEIFYFKGRSELYCAFDETSFALLYPYLKQYDACIEINLKGEYRKWIIG